MKKLILLIAALFMSASLFSQTSEVTLTSEDIAKLSPELKAQISQIQFEKDISGKLETAGKWVGLGREIGTAMNESLTAITTTASNFAETHLGKFTMVLVAWKVIGTDFLQLCIGLLWIVIVLVVSFFMYRNNTDRRVLMNKRWIPEAKQFELKYEIKSGDDEFKAASVVILCVGLIAALIIIFV